MRKRLDLLLVERGLAPTRSRARDLVKGGKVLIDGEACFKAGAEVDEDEALSLREAGPLVALDVGASTGGFTEVLLARGAAKVYAIDVGHGQLHASLRDHPRVVSFEGCDARSLNRTLIPEPVAAIVADVSFISLTKALLPALALATPGAWLVALVKPQFEVGRGGIGKGGIVREPAARQQAVDTVTAWLSVQASWRIAGVVPSPIKGGSGNEEFLLGARCDG